jgi:adenosylcobinamide kinase / adenosylcobinamide-phosphate guanylyltransferase
MGPRQPSPVPITLVLGGARSGKSRFAEGLLAEAVPRSYLATAEPGDAEMAARIAAHRLRRGGGWVTVEEPLELVPALRRTATAGGGVLVDCLTLWLANLLGAGRDPAAAGRALAEALPALPGRVVLVSNEVGLGIVPDNALARAFRDHAGGLHQAIAAVAQRVYWVAAGLPLLMKDGIVEETA